MQTRQRWFDEQSSFPAMNDVPKTVSRLDRVMTTALRGHLATLVLTVGFLWLAGCTTPDLKPFADASATLSSSVKVGGELAINPISTIPVWNGDVFVSPRDPAHPYKSLEGEWEKRRKTMDAVLVYSASLQAISEAAAHRSDNATALVQSVQQLASSVPGYGAAFDTAGKLVIKGIETTVEVKAWHDMRRAVASADPAIQMIAGSLQKDLSELANLMKAPLNDRITALGASLRPVVRLETTLRERRDTQRKTVAETPTDATAGAELARLDSLYQTALADLTQMREERARTENSIKQGQEFFANAVAGVNAWADAHRGIVQAFQEKRMPNFTLLAARAQELREIVNELKKK